MLAACLAAAILTSVLAMTASANEYVNLYYDQTSAVSPTVTDPYVVISGDNSPSSKHSVYFTAQYYSSGWRDDVQSLVGAGSSLGGLASFRFNSAVDWRLELNPEGYGYTKCTATGEIY